jgi:hypothetical protein
MNSVPMMLDRINSSLLNTSNLIKNIGYCFARTEKHLLDRINDRSIDKVDVITTISYLTNKKLCEFIYNLEHNESEFVSFGIQYDQDFVIVGTCRKNNNIGYNIIKFNTVVKYPCKSVLHQGGFILKINKLIRKVNI